MRYKLVACKALMREFSWLAAKSPNFVDATFLRQGLHDTPKILHKRLQQEICRIEQGEDLYSCPPRHGKDFDAILLGYGLCSNALLGLRTRKYPLVLPRSHDCIALLMGSRAAYDKFCLEHNGCYYYTPSWIENAFTPSEQSNNARRAELVEKYGEDNADYIMETENYIANYSGCAYIHWKELPFPAYEEYTREAARYLGFEYFDVQGDSGYLAALIGGEFDPERFLVVPPGHQVVPTYDTDIFTAQPIPPEDEEEEEI